MEKILRTYHVSNWQGSPGPVTFESSVRGPPFWPLVPTPPTFPSQLRVEFSTINRICVEYSAHITIPAPILTNIPIRPIAINPHAMVLRSVNIGGQVGAV